jgi:hypothetical protein
MLLLTDYQREARYRNCGNEKGFLLFPEFNTECNIPLELGCMHDVVQTSQRLLSSGTPNHG